MLNLGTLSVEHAEIDEIAAALLDIAVRSKGPVAGIAAQRWRLNHLLAVHLAKEDKHLYPTLKMSSDAEIAAIARRFEAEMGGLAAAYAAYAQRWDASAVADDWAGFCADTREVLTALRLRIRREERDLYPKLAKAMKLTDEAAVRTARSA